MKVLVLGVGNLLLRDEGAGVRELEEFERRYEVPAGVELLDGGTSGIELLHHFRGLDLLIILDVVRNGSPPGAVFRMSGEEVPTLFRKRISPHQLGLSDVLAAAALTDSMPGAVVLLGIEPRAIETGLKLSEEVAANIGALAEMVVADLSAVGVAVTRRTGPCSHFPSITG